MADTSRILTRATEAFVDRHQLDWGALLSRVRRSPEREWLENLRVVSLVREQCLASSIVRRRASMAAWIVVACGTIETIAFLTLLAAAWTHGDVDGSRTAQLVIAIAFAAPCVWLGFAAGRDPRSLFLLATFACAASVFSRSAAASWSRPLDELLRGIWIEAFLPACVWQFALDFPDVTRFTAFDRFGRRAAGCAWLLGAILFIVNAALTRQAIAAPRLRLLLRGDSSHWFWHLFSLALAPALAGIFVRASRAPAAQRRKVARLATAVAGGLAPFIALSVMRIAMPAVDAWFRSESAPGRDWIYGFVVAALASTPILSTAAVLVDRPFELQSLWRRASKYALSTGVLIGVATAPLIVLFVGAERSGGADGANLRFRLLLACAFGGWLIVLARQRLLTAINRRFSLRTRAGPARIAGAVQHVAHARGVRERADALAGELRRAVGVKSVRILMPASGGAFADWSRSPIVLRQDGALVAMLRNTSEALDLSPAGALMPLLPRADRDWAVGNDVQLVAPLKRRDGQLGALVVLSRKTGGFPFDRADRALIATFTAAAGAAWSGDDWPLLATPTLADHAGTTDEAAFECPECGLVSTNVPLRCRCASDPVLAAVPFRLSSKFVVERRIGSGGCGVVYLGRDTALDRAVALKTLSGLRPDGIARLRREARAMAAVNHECVATLYGLEIWQGTPVLVVEYLSRGTLAQRLSAGTLSATETVTLGLRLARALVYMHDKGVVHRDIKPSNIGFTETGTAKVLDFGLATLAAAPAQEQEADAHQAAFGGTLAYLPRGALGRPPDASDDLWAIGVVMLEAVTGTNPFATRRRAIGDERCGRSDPLETCLRRTDSVPSLRAFLDRMLVPSTGERFQTAREVQNALQRVADALDVFTAG